MEKPTKQPIINIAGIIAACEEYIDFIESDNFHQDKIGDYENQIYEKAIEGIMGQNVFKFINSKID